MLTPKDIEEQLLKSFPKARVRALDMTGGGDHWQVSIEAQQFSGKSLVEQHQLVYAALKEWMNREIHALSLNTQPIEE